MNNLESDKPSIILDTYHGKSRDRLQLNTEIAGQFMRKADLRLPIAVVERTPLAPRVQNNFGSERFPKAFQDILGIPDQRVRTRREDDIYFVEINDETCAKQAASQQPFSEALMKGLRECLIEDKLFNGGIFGLEFALGYFYTLFSDVYLPATYIANYLTTKDLPSLLYGAAKVAFFHIAFNTLGTTIAHAQSQMTKGRRMNLGFILTALPDDPFFKRSVIDFIAPPIPIDRLIRGLIFLRNHRSDFLTP